MFRPFLFSDAFTILSLNFDPEVIAQRIELLCPIGRSNRASLIVLKNFKICILTLRQIRPHVKFPE